MTDVLISIGIDDTFIKSRHKQISKRYEDEESLEEIWDALENSTLVQVLLCIISGKNYATAIAKVLKKKQPTVTEQLKQLEGVGLIKALKRRKAQKYDVDWDLLLEVFYDLIEDVLELRKEYFASDELEKIEKTNLQGIIPRDLVKGFLKEYFDTFMSVGGKKKGFDEIIFSFFSAINKLEERDRRRLVRKFRIDEKILAVIADAVEFETYGVEQTALTSFLEFSRSS